MVKVSENENLNSDEKLEGNLDFIFGNITFREMCKKSLKELFRGRLESLERDMLLIMENELARQKAKYADAPKAVSEFLENALMESLCSALGSANATARLRFLGERPAEDASDAFTEWLKAKGVNKPCRVRYLHKASPSNVYGDTCLPLLAFETTIGDTE